jgi:ribose/xylose/arabinose/galactoside ABC-type transport system permease subunit
MTEDLDRIDNGRPGAHANEGARGQLGSLTRSFGAWETVLLGIVVLELFGFSMGSHGFFGNGEGALKELQQFPGIAIAAVGLGFVIITGGIDLSIGSVASLSGVLMAELWSAAGIPIFFAALISLIVATLIGVINGLIITIGRVHSLIVTLATMFVVASIAQVVEGTPKPYTFPESFLVIGNGSFAGIPISDLIFFAVALVAGFVAGFTPFGRKLIMIGSNEAAARYAGVRIQRILVINYAQCSFLAGLAGLVMTSLYVAARADLAEQLLLPALTAGVMGGLNIFGGSGTVRGVVLGVLVVGFLQQGLLLYGVNSVEVQLLTGLLLAGSVAARNMFSGQALRDRLTKGRPRGGVGSKSRRGADNKKANLRLTASHR